MQHYNETFLKLIIDVNFSIDLQIQIYSYLWKNLD